MNVPAYVIFMQKTMKVPHGVLDAGSEVHEIVVVLFHFSIMVFTPCPCIFGIAG